MRNKLLAWTVISLFVTVLSSVGILAYLQRKATVRRFHEQHQAIVDFAVSNIEMGLRDQDYRAVKEFLNTLKAYAVFEGIVIFEGNKPVLVYPENLVFPAERLLQVGQVRDGEISYEIRTLKYGDEPETEKVAVAFTLAPMNAEGRRTLAIAFVLSVFLLVPTMGMSVWRLRWYENALRENERAAIARNHELEQTEVSLRKTKREIEHILHHLEEGIFTLNPDGSVNEEHSQRAEELFGITDFRAATLSTIFGPDRARVESFRKWLALLNNPGIRRHWRMVEKLIPFRELRRKDRGGLEQIIKLEFRPIDEDGRIRKLMVLATDVTGAIRAEAELARTRAERENLKERVLAFVNNDKMAVEMFMWDVDRYVTKFSQVRTTRALSDNVAELYRDVHTIKGNAGTFGFSKLAQIAGRVEEQFVKLRGCVTPAMFLVWTRGVTAMIVELVEIDNFRRRFFIEENDRIALSQTGYVELKRRLCNGAVTDPAEVYRLICNLDSMPLSSYCKKYRNILRDYKRAYRKNIAELRIEQPDANVQREVMQAFDPALVHIIRNAADHGIESDDERKKSGKAFGMITLSYWQEAAWHCFKVADNGRGIDTAMVLQQAVDKGIVLPDKAGRMNRDEIIQLIFMPGFSTKSEITEISGRGIGMETVKSHLTGLGGTVEVETEINIGTTFILRIPVEFGPMVRIVDEAGDRVETKPFGV
jgi:signal transduction histidine kinase